MDGEAKRVGQIVDKIGRPLDRILITPLFGNVIEFLDIKPAIEFINKVPDKMPDTALGFICFEIRILYLDKHPEDKVSFKTKDLVINYFKLLYDF